MQKRIFNFNCFELRSFKLSIKIEPVAQTPLVQEETTKDMTVSKPTSDFKSFCLDLSDEEEAEVLSPSKKSVTTELDSVATSLVNKVVVTTQNNASQASTPLKTTTKINDKVLDKNLFEFSDEEIEKEVEETTKNAIKMESHVAASHKTSRSSSSCSTSSTSSTSSSTSSSSTSASSSVRSSPILSPTIESKASKNKNPLEFSVSEEEAESYSDEEEISVSKLKLSLNNMSVTTEMISDLPSVEDKLGWLYFLMLILKLINSIIIS